MRLLDDLGRALLDAGSMTWQITWSLILGAALSDDGLGHGAPPVATV